MSDTIVLRIRSGLIDSSGSFFDNAEVPEVGSREINIQILDQLFYYIESKVPALVSVVLLAVVISIDPNSIAKNFFIID